MHSQRACATMFTDVCRFQQPHNPPTSVPHHNGDGFPDTFHVLPFRKTTHRKDKNHSQNTSFGQRLQQQQQNAANSSQRLSTSSSQLSTERAIPPVTVDTEHMLRRKTPNGTLAAGYDGRWTESEARLRAAKHILMPAADSIGGTRQCTEGGFLAGQCSEPPFGEALKAHLPNEKGQQHHQTTFHLPSSTPFQLLIQDRGTEAVFDKTPVTYQGHGAAPGVDSVLSQGQIFHPGLIPGDGHDVPTVLQPMWPPCLRSTSLDSTGRYGPYWPDGAFEPYRPAPLIDSRYPSYRRGSSVRGIPSPQPGVSNWWQRSPNRESNPRWRFPGLSNTQHAVLNHAGAPFHTNGPLTNDMILASQGPGRDRAQDRHGNAPPRVPGSLEGIVQGPDYATVLSDAMETMTNQKELVQFKEKALLWAHRIYVSLLASIHQSRRSSSIGHSYGERRFHSSIYPRPPRQSSVHPAVAAHLESDNEQTYPSQNVEERRAHMPGLASGPVGSRGSSGPPYETSKAWGSRSSHRWQLYKQQHPFPQVAQSPSTRGRTTSDGYDSIPRYPESSPTMAALSALELLSKLCHESGWQWTDGMLLGGCLAYGLGDYSRALKWYSNVLRCDPRCVALYLFSILSNVISAMWKLSPIWPLLYFP